MLVKPKKNRLWGVRNCIHQYKLKLLLSINSIHKTYFKKKSLIQLFFLIYFIFPKNLQLSVLWFSDAEQNLLKLKVQYRLWISNVQQPVETLIYLIFAAVRIFFPFKGLMPLNSIYDTAWTVNTLIYITI